jgi:peptide/nickel transport system ATP-binding protein
MTTASEPVLRIEGLGLDIGAVSVLDGVDLHLAPGRILALVGESGCGKSLTALSVLNLLPSAVSRRRGSIQLAGRELVGLEEPALRDVRGREASIIFQEPVASLNPLMRVGEQVAEVLDIHQPGSPHSRADQVLEMLAKVGIPDPGVRARQFPFELSGGMCQRVMIAAALVARPRLLIADEPTTALDVTIQAQILDLIKRLRDEVGTAVLLITHDMGVVAEMADEVAVMYGGRVVESGPTDLIFEQPAHPYTRLLLQTVPRLDGQPRHVLPVIEGMVPSAAAWPEGCRFAPRCPQAHAACTRRPPMQAAGPAMHQVACWARVQACASSTQ